MLATLILMITGRTPIYMTAITGAAISAIVAGFPLAGGQGMTVTKMIVSGLNPVIADMTGILLFIGIMQATGFLDVIIRDIVRVGNKIGGGVGVGAAGGVAAATTIPLIPTQFASVADFFVQVCLMVVGFAVALAFDRLGKKLGCE